MKKLTRRLYPDAHVDLGDLYLTYDHIFGMSDKELRCIKEALAVLLADLQGIYYDGEEDKELAKKIDVIQSICREVGLTKNQVEAAQRSDLVYRRY